MACFQPHSDDPVRHWCQPNRRLLPVKGFFFTFFAATGCLLPFIAVYMKHLGLSSLETGIIYGVMPFLSFLVRPLVGAMADRWLKHKAVLIVCTLLTAVLHLLLMFVPARVTPTSLHVHPVVLHCHPEGSMLTSCLPVSSYAGNVRIPEPEVGDGDRSGCSVPLDKVAISPSGATGVDEDKDNVSEDVVDSDRQDRGNSMSSLDFLNSTATRSSRRGTCTLICHMNLSTSTAHNDHLNATHGFCFSNHQDTGMPLCQAILNKDQTLTLNITKLKRLFREVLSDDRAVMADCSEAYQLNDMESHGQTYTHLTCAVSTAAMCHMRCAGVSVMKLCGSVEAVRLDTTFGLLMVVSFFATAAFSPVFSLMDDVTFDQLGDQRHRYGQQRMWGTLGLAIFAITTTFTMNPGRDDNLDDVNYNVMFYLFTGLCALSACIAACLKTSPRAKCQRFLKDTCGLLVLPEVLAFLTVVLYLGMVSGAIEGFLFWYLAVLGAEPLLFGLCLTVNCAFEIPFFFFSGLILKRLKPTLCLCLSMLVLTARLLGYSLLVSPWHVLLLEWLHGVTFGVMWAAVVSHADVISPPGMSASVQGLVGGMNFGVGKGLGSLLTGHLFGAIGERWTFRVLAVTCLLLLTLYVLLNTCVFRQRLTPRSTSSRPGQDAETKEEDPCQMEMLSDHVTPDNV